jgi:hypothetical protein
MKMDKPHLMGMNERNVRDAFQPFPSHRPGGKDHPKRCGIGFSKFMEVH